jgi:hypothetical protein
MLCARLHDRKMKLKITTIKETCFRNEEISIYNTFVL